MRNEAPVAGYSAQGRAIAASIGFFVVPIAMALIISRLIGDDWNWSIIIFVAPIGAAAVWGRREKQRREGSKH